MSITSLPLGLNSPASCRFKIVAYSWQPQHLMKVYLNESKSDFDNPLLTTDNKQSSLSIVWIFAYLSILSSRPATMSLMGFYKMMSCSKLWHLLQFLSLAWISFMLAARFTCYSTSSLDFAIFILLTSATQFVNYAIEFGLSLRPIISQMSVSFFLAKIPMALWDMLLNSAKMKSSCDLRTIGMRCGKPFSSFQAGQITDLSTSI